MVHKNTSVIVKRVPMNPAKKAALSKFPNPMQRSTFNAPVKTGDAEDAKIQAMISEGGEQYGKGQADFSKASSKRFGTNANVRPPPASTCYKCGQKDHFIQNCPMNEAPKVKKTTGIPKTFLKAVDPNKDKNALLTISQGALMMSPEGGLVLARPNAVDWNKMTAHRTESSILSSIAIPKELQCPICKALLNDAVATQCCSSVYCDDCIRKVLLSTQGFSCPNCKEKCNPDTLQSDSYSRKRVEEYISNSAPKQKEEPKKNDKQEEKASLSNMPEELSIFIQKMNQVGSKRHIDE